VKPRVFHGNSPLADPYCYKLARGVTACQKTAEHCLLRITSAPEDGGARPSAPSAWSAQEIVPCAPTALPVARRWTVDGRSGWSYRDRVRGNHLKSNGGALADGADANFGRRSGQRRTGRLTLLSGFEGIDGGKATTPQDGIDSLHCQVMYLRALIKRNPPEGLIDRFRQVQARVDYGRPSLARRVEPLSGSSGASFRHNAPATVLWDLGGILAGIDFRRYRASRSRARDLVRL
jgi:hypothetical protein